MNDFNKRTLKALTLKGISLIGLQALPNMAQAMPFANAERGYVMNDNGTCRVWTFAQVLEAAK